MADEPIRLVTRGDDSGSCLSANRAICDAYRDGILRNTSLMVCAPAFEEAAEMLLDLPGLEVGLHATVTAEWDTVRWGPVLGPERVPSIVDDKGNLPQTTQALHDMGAEPDEMVAEIQAQLDLARERGLDVRYVDTHMGFGWIADMDERMARFAEREGLVYRPPGLSRLPDVEGEFADVVERLIARLTAAAPGTYLIVGHPCYDTEDVRRFHHKGMKPGSEGLNRDWQRRMFMDPRIVEFVSARGIQPIRYTQVEGG
jgi:predicted glycoside hydrolase/deacetylase ChbG (UPF0249 family)